MESLDDLVTIMTVAHRQNIWDILHDEDLRKNFCNNTYELLIQEVSGIFRIAWTNLAEPLAGRPAIDKVDASANEIVSRGDAWVLLAEKPADVAFEKRSVGKVRCMRAAGIAINLYRAEHVIAREPDALAKPTCAAEERDSAEPSTTLIAPAMHSWPLCYGAGSQLEPSWGRVLVYVFKKMYE